MGQITKTYACLNDARTYSPNLGSGTSTLPIGLWLGEVWRSYAKFALPDWTGDNVRRIVSAKVRFYNSTQVHAGRGASPRVLFKRATSKFIEDDNAGLSSSGPLKHPGPSTTATDQTDSGVLATANNALVEEDVTAIVRKWAPATVENGGAQPNYGFAMHSFNEGSGTATTEFWDRGSSKKPVLVVVFETNTAPSAPTTLVPAANADGSASILPVFRSITFPGLPVIMRGIFATFSGARVDPDPGDYITGVEVAIHADAATDATPGAVLVTSTHTDFSGTPDTYARIVNISSLTIGTSYRARVRTRDKDLVWGAWSSFTATRFKPNTLPGAPSNLSVDTATQTPNFYGSLVDPDPAAAWSEVQIEVYQDTSLGAVAKWLSAWITSGGTRFAIAYAGGQVIEFGTQYRFRARGKDNLGSEGPWSAWFYWTPKQVFGADNMTPRTVETKQNSVTPTLTIAHSAAFDAHELEVARYLDGSELLWDVPPTAYASTSSKAITYAGAALDWGRTYYWRAKIRVAGITWSDWSPWYAFYVNARPLPPTPVGVSASVPTGYLSGLGTPYLATTTITPVLTFPYRDPDRDKGYTDNPVRREIEVKVAATGANVSGSPFVITSGITDDFTVPGATLSMETGYATRARYDDNASQRSDWTEFQYFKPSVAPAVTAGAAVDNTDPAPLIDWAFASSGGKLQARYQVLVYETATGQLVHDSGVVTSVATQYAMPGDLLLNAIQYRADVVAWDTDSLSGTLAIGAWTTSFSAPAVLTGLVATPDLDASEIDLVWDVTALSDAHFWRYRVYRRNRDTGELVLIGEVSDKTTPAFSDVEAPHRLSTDYLVTVSNGWAESEPIEASATLDLDWWIKHPTDPGMTTELKYVNRAPARHAYQQAQFEPLDRPHPVVVSGQMLSPAGSIGLQVHPDNASLIGLLLRIARVDPYVLLKDPFSNVRRVKLGSVDEDRGQAGIRDAGFEYRTVA